MVKACRRVKKANLEAHKEVLQRKDIDLIHPIPMHNLGLVKNIPILRYGEINCKPVGYLFQ